MSKNLKQYNTMSSKELNKEFMSKKEELFNLRFQHSTGQLKNPLAIRTVRKDIARIMTILNESELQITKNPGKVGAKKDKKGGAK